MARAEHLRQIKRLAREQLAAEGATNLSLRAIARDLGMVSSAIYRYYASRDDLMTALIIDAYDALGAAAEVADAGRERTDLAGRWRAVATAAYDWAEANPAEYGLIFGTPVPGYSAPDDTIGPASRYTAVLVAILVDAKAAGHRPVGPGPSAETRAQVAALLARTGISIDEESMFAGMNAWVAVFGAISFSRFGHFHNVLADPRPFFADLVETQAARIVGLPA